MKKTMTNAEIYGLSQALNLTFNNEERYLPARINYFISKNKNNLALIVESIEKVRKDIIIQYGNISENNEISFSDSNIKKANEELEDLLNVSQEIDVALVKLSDLNGLDFTPKQMQALLFMIEED